MKQYFEDAEGKPCESPPTRGRGLKPDAKTATRNAWQSPPTRGRGLKHTVKRLSEVQGVAPHAGAWIETTNTLK